MAHHFSLPILIDKESVKRQAGFTLIELLVVIAMLALLVSLFIGIFNPVEQYNKSADAKRQTELNQVKVALDSYYNDTGCYPRYLVFNQSWTLGNTVYSKKLPEDPSCVSDSTHCFTYETDGSICPQWNVLYAKMRSQGTLTASNKILCPLQLMNSTCVPSDFGGNTGYNYCVTSGTVSCNYIAANPVPTPASGGQQQPGVTPTPPSPPIAASCAGVAPSSPNYKRYLCNGTCQDAGQGNGYYCVRDCEGAC